MLDSISSIAGFHLSLGARVLLVVTLTVLALCFLGAMGRDSTYGKPGAAVAGAIGRVVKEAEVMARGDEGSRNQAIGLLKAAEIVGGSSLQSHTEVDLKSLVRRLREPQEFDGDLV